MRTRRSRVPDMTYAADPVVIDDVLARLSAIILASGGNRDLLSGWAVARLATKLGITIIQTSSVEPVEVVHDLGADWAALLIQLNKNHPEQAHRVLLAAGEAFRAVQRGMQPPG